MKCLSNDTNLIASQQIIVCMKEGRSTKVIISKINSAACNLYIAKQWEENDLDLAVMVLRICGPSLLHAFSSKNRLPSTSYIYKITKSEIDFKFSFDLKNFLITQLDFTVLN